MNHQDNDHDRRLAFDLSVLNRRRAMTLLGGAGLAVLVGCSSGDDESGNDTSTTDATGRPGSDDTTTVDGACEPIPEETAGPFPGDGSNGPDVLSEDGVVRSDITSSIGSSSGVAGGVPLTIDLTIQNGNGCAAMPGAAVYVWHCDREGRYSMYSEGATEENYLRGVQEADADGRLTFQSIFPGAYQGRWPHIHFDVYASLGDATGGGSPVTTSQLALPEATCEAAYATDGYDESVRNLAETSLESDMVFSDGVDQQMAGVDGNADDGFTASLNVMV